MMNLEDAAVEKDASGNNIVDEFEGLKAAKIDSPSHNNNNYNNNENTLQKPLIPAENEESIKLKPTPDIATSQSSENSQIQPKPKVDDDAPKSSCCVIM